MERAEQEILQWAKAGEEFSTPGWEELPGIPLKARMMNTAVCACPLVMMKSAKRVFM